MREIFILFLVGIIGIVLMMVLPIVTMIIYNGQFGRRREVNECEAYQVSDFAGLEVKHCSITAKEGHQLAGYQYSLGNEKKKGVLVLVHGLCGSHRNYLDVCNYFASNGYYVFTYDATGNGASEGKKVGGFPQGLSDLDCVLHCVKKIPEYLELPIFLMGHSWGGYCVGNILNFHSDIKAVVSVSGFDSSRILLKQYTQVHMGKAVALLMPYISLYEILQWGRYATTTACQGFAGSDAKVMIIHSTDDETVHMETGYGRYYEQFGKDDRFVFRLYDDRGHAYPLNSDVARAYRTKLMENFEATADRNICMELDEVLMRDIIEMFEKSECGPLSKKRINFTAKY